MVVTCESGHVVDRAAAGDQQAWEQLMRQHDGRLRSIAAGFRLNHSDAEDAMQTTWLSLIRNVHRLHSQDRLGAWLNTTMRRNCLRTLQRRRWEEVSDDLPSNNADPCANVEQILVVAERARMLWQAVERLPPKQAELLRVLFADGRRSYQDIASSLRMPVGTIGPIRQRALRRLAQLLDEAGTPPEELRRSA